MTRVAPVSLRFVRPEWATEVSSPPHDALSPAQRRAHLASHPRSFLGVTRGRDDLEPGSNLSSRELLALGRRSLDSMLEDGLFGDRNDPALYLYRLRTDDHEQTGLLCAVATDAYDAGMVRIHEQIRTERASHLADHLEIVGAQSSPIAMAFRDSPIVSDLFRRIPAETTPLLSFQADDGLAQDVFAITDEADVDAVLGILAEQPLYLIDGHHRAAAASIHQSRRIAAGDDRSGWMLAALFPTTELRNLAFHRILRGLRDGEADRVMARIEERFETTHTDDPVVVARRDPAQIAVARHDPDRPDGSARWSLIRLPLTGEESGNRLVDLEPVRLNQLILGPVLGLDEAGAGDAIGYRPGAADARSLAEIRPDANELVFVMRPVPMSTLLAVADRGQVMPPKSTYFQPKVRSGVFVRLVYPGG